MNAQLEDIKARLAAATPGPWRWDGPEQIRQALRGSGAQEIMQCGALLHPEYRNASLIANAPTDLAHLVAAVEAVLALHRPEFTDSGEGDGLGYWICSECASESDKYTDSCPTVAAVEAALLAEP